MPQRSIHSTLLFLIFINDLPDNLICKTKRFNDGIFLNAVMVNKDLSSKNLKDDPSNLYYWSVKWTMVINPDPNKPAEEVVLTTRNIHIHLHLDSDSKMSYM